MDNKQYDVLDVLNILSFLIGVKNLEENVSQTDVTKLVNTAINDIHEHLKMQDQKIDKILEAVSNDENKEIC